MLDLASSFLTRCLKPSFACNSISKFLSTVCSPVIRTETCLSFPPSVVTVLQTLAPLSGSKLSLEDNCCSCSQTCLSLSRCCACAMELHYIIKPARGHFFHRKIYINITVGSMIYDIWFGIGLPTRLKPSVALLVLQNAPTVQTAELQLSDSN